VRGTIPSSQPEVPEMKEEGAIEEVKRYLHADE
jgi:hypothetical protein